MCFVSMVSILQCTAEETAVKTDALLETEEVEVRNLLEEYIDLLVGDTLLERWVI